MYKRCPFIHGYDACREDKCGVWDEKRNSCGLITQPTIDAEELVYWMRDQIAEKESHRHD